MRVHMRWLSRRLNTPETTRRASGRRDRGRPWACLVAAGLLAGGTAAGQNDTYAAARKAYAAMPYDVAATMVARAAAAEQTTGGPAHSDSLLLEARRLSNLGRYAAAEAVVRQYLKGEPQSAPALYLLGRLQQLQNRPKESLETFTAAAALSRPTGEDLRVVALDYVLLEDYPDALVWSARAVGMEPGNGEAWYDLGREQMHEGRFVEAMDALQRSLAARPGNAKALDNLGICLENQNRPDEALAAYAAAVKATSAAVVPLAQPYIDEGKLLVTRNAFAEAAGVLQRATELAPKDAAAFTALATARTGLGQTAQARAAMERAVALDPGNPRLHYQLARIYRTAGEAALADREFKQSAALYGGHSSE